MHITGIIAENFRNIENVELTNLPKSVALFGWNGQGKTTILCILRMALFGHCQFTQRNGNGFQDLIRKGEDAAYSSVDLTQDDHDYTIITKLPRKGSREWKCVDTATGKESQGIISPETFWHYLGIDMRQALVAGMPRAFLHSKELGDLLSELFAGDIERSEIFEASGDHANWLCAFAHKNHVDLSTASGLKALGDAAFADRTGHNRDLKAAKAVLADMSQTVAPKDSKKKKRSIDEIPTIQNVLAGLEMKRGELQRDLGACEAGRTAEEIGDEKKEVEQRLQKVIETNQKVDEDLKQLREEEAAAKVAVTFEVNHIADLEKQLQALDDAPKSGDKCTACDRKLSDAAVKKMNADLPDEAELLSEKIVAAESLSNAEAILAETTQKIESFIPCEFESLYRDRLAALDNEKPAGDPKAIQSEIDALSEKAERGRELLGNLVAFQEYTRQQKHIESLEADTIPLEWAVKAFRDGEVTKSFMSDDAEDFESRCNVRLKSFGHSLKVEAKGKKVGLILSTDSGEFPIAQVSQGQQAAAEHAIAMAFADTGAPVMLDDTNEMDALYRRNVLMQAKCNDANSIFIAAAWQQSDTDMTPKAKALAPIQIVWAEGGQYTQIETGKGEGK